MENKCHDTFEEVVKIHDVAKGLARGWDDGHFTTEFRDEFIGKLRRRTESLAKNGRVTHLDDINRFLDVLDNLDELNRNNQQIPGILKEHIDELTSDLAINAILDCGCREAGTPVEYDNLREIFPNEVKHGK